MSEITAFLYNIGEKQSYLINHQFMKELRIQTRKIQPKIYFLYISHFGKQQFTSILFEKVKSILNDQHFNVPLGRIWTNHFFIFICFCNSLQGNLYSRGKWRDRLFWQGNHTIAWKRPFFPVYYTNLFFPVNKISLVLHLSINSRPCH